MKVAAFRNGAHRATVSTSHRGEWIKLRVSNGHDEVEITLKPSQATTICENLMTEVAISHNLAQRKVDNQNQREEA